MDCDTYIPRVGDRKEILQGIKESKNKDLMQVLVTATRQLHMRKMVLNCRPYMLSNEACEVSP